MVIYTKGLHLEGRGGGSQNHKTFGGGTTKHKGFGGGEVKLQYLLLGNVEIVCCFSIFSVAQ